MGFVLRQIDTITLITQRTGKPYEIKVYTHVNTSKRYAPNGRRECARRVRQATLRAIRGELRRFKKAAA